MILPAVYTINIFAWRSDENGELGVIARGLLYFAFLLCMEAQEYVFFSMCVFVVCPSHPCDLRDLSTYTYHSHHARVFFFCVCMCSRRLVSPERSPEFGARVMYSAAFETSA